MEAIDMPALTDDSHRLLLLRLEAVVPDRPEGECWEPTLKSRINGYVPMAFQGHRTLLHRWMYLAYVGEPGPVLDHKVCDNRTCCNPAHLEPATHRVNILRGGAPTAHNATKDRCVQGHQFDEQNTYLYTDKSGRRRRVCRKCDNAKSVAYQRERNRKAMASKYPDWIKGVTCRRGHRRDDHGHIDSNGKWACRKCQSIRDQR